MRNDELKKDDVLRQYLNAGDIHKAPEGFSSKVMSHIYMENRPVRKEKTYLVPLVSAAIFIALILATVLIPGTSDAIIGFDFSKIKFPEFTIPEKLHFSVPEFSGGSGISRTLMYVICGMAAIAIFDFALNSVFRKDKKINTEHR